MQQVVSTGQEGIAVGIKEGGLRDVGLQRLRPHRPRATVPVVAQTKTRKKKDGGLSAMERARKESH
jgi:hypothetical protein